MKLKTLLLAPCLALLVAPLACDDGEPDLAPYECSEEEVAEPEMGGANGTETASCEAPEPPVNEIEIAGDYTDNFGSSHEIRVDSWGSVNLSYVDNEENYAIGRNDESAEWNGCYWSLFVWHEVDDKLYYCQSAYSATSECLAMDTALPDTEDLETGCAGFPWSELIAD
jgi:hypothetical protein